METKCKLKIGSKVVITLGYSDYKNECGKITKIMQGIFTDKLTYKVEFNNGHNDLFYEDEIKPLLKLVV